MDDGMLVRLALVGGYLPLRGRRTYQHQARGRTTLAHGVEEAPDRMRSVGVLRTITWVSDCLVDLDAAPVGVQFVGDHQRERGPNSGAHLRTVGYDSHGAVGFDRDEDIGLEDGRPGAALSLAGLREQEVRGKRHAEH